MTVGKRIALAVIVILSIVLGYHFGLSSYVSLTALQGYAHSLKMIVDDHYVLSVIVYSFLLIVVIVFGLPLVTLFALAAGYLFGLFWGFIYSDLAMSIGACVAVLIYRYFLFNYLAGAWSRSLSGVIQEVKSHGGSYLLSMQLLSGIPFFIINTVAVIARIPLRTVFWTSAVGSVPFLLIYLIAGRQLLTIRSVRDLLTPSMMIVLILIAFLALLPIVLKKMKARHMKKE